MAEEKMTVLIDVQVESAAAVQRQQELKTSLEGAKKELIEIGKAQGVASEAYIKAEANINSLNQQIRNNGTVLKQMASNTTEVSGAYAALNQRSAEAAQRAKDLAVAYGANDARTIEAAKSARALSDQLKAVDAATGQHFRNVGDYSDQIIIASKSINGMKTQLSDLQAKLNDLDINSDEFKDTKRTIDELSLAVDQAAGKVDEFGNKEPKNIAKKNFEDTMVTVGILSSSINALSSAFGDNEATQAALTKATQALAISQSVANVVKEKGAIIDTVVLAKEKALALGKIVLTNLTRIFGLTSVQAWAAATLGLSLLITGITVLIANFDAVISSVKSFFGITNEFAETESKIKSLSQAMEGFSESTQLATDRMKAEGRSDQEILNFKKKRYNEELAMHRSRYTNLKKITRDLTDDEKSQLEESAKFIKDSTAQKYKFQTEQIALTRAANLKEAEEEKRSEEEKKKKREENQKKRLEDEKKAEADRIRLLKENADKAIEVLNYEIEMAKLKEQKRLAGQKQSDAEIHSNKIANIQQNYTDELSKLKAKLENEQITKEEYLKAEELLNQQKNTNIAIENAAFDEAEAQRKEDLKKVQDQKSLEAEQMRLDNEYALAQGDVDRQLQLTTEKLKLQKSAEIAAAEGNAELIAQINEKYRIADIDAHLAAQQAKQEAFMKYAEQGMNIASGLNDFVNALGNAELARFEKQNKGKAGFEEEYAKKKEKLERQAAIRNKALSVMSTVMSTAQSIMAALAIPLGAGVPLAIANGVAGALQVATILATPIPGGGGGGTSGGASNISAPSASISAAANVTGGLVSRQSGQAQQAATQQAVSTALSEQPTKTVLVTNDLTTALNEKVALKTDNGL